MNGAEDYPQDQRSEPPGSSLQKICRRGDKIYQAPNENITMINTKFPNVINEMTKTPHAAESIEVDDVESGESLFKTFTFDRKMSKRETEKCISFWRSVVEKQLEPIKCTLIENTKSRADAAASHQKRASASREPRKKSTSIAKGSTESRASKSTENGSNKWNEILLELQKKKIAEMELQLEKKCRFCGYLNSPPYKTQDPEQQNKQMIAELDDWKPKSCRQLDLKFLRKGSRSNRSSISSRKKSVKSDPAIIGENLGLETVLETDQQQHMAEKRKLEEIRIASLDIKHVDLIAEKKKKGLYSQWRKNNLATCECDGMKCDCSTNPAIKKTTLDPTSKQHRRSGSIVSKGTATSKQQDDEILFVSKAPERNSIDAKICAESPEFLTKQTERESIDLVSITSSTEEDTREVTISEAGKYLHIEPPSDSNTATSQDIQTNDNPPIVSKPQTEERESEFDRGLGAMDNQSSDIAITMLPPGNIYQTESPPSVPLQIPRRSILISQENKQRTKRISSRSTKSLSVMIQCTCSYEKCDCKGFIKLPQKSALSKEELTIPKPPKLEKSLQRVNSIELIKRRFSSIQAVPDTKAFPKIGYLESDKSPSSLPKRVDSLEIVRRRLSRLPTRQEKDDEQQQDESVNVFNAARKARASITFK